MSNVKLQASASGTGTVTIAPPVTNSDLTINLPANSGTVPTIASVVNNGVVYTNSTGAITSSSALTFDGTNLGVGTSTPGQKLDVRGAVGAVYVNSTTGTNQAQLQLNNSGGDFYFALENSAGNNFNTGAAYAGVIWRSGANPICFVNNSTLRATLDSSGNLGLGVTPSAWGGAYKALQFGIDGVLNATTSTTNGVILAKNFFNNGTSNRYINTDFASFYQQISGQHQWFTAPSGTAGNAISFTQAMTLTAGGDLGVGSTSPNILSLNRALTLNSTGNQQGIEFAVSGAVKGLIQSNGDTEFIMGSFAAIPLTFRTGNTERARIDSSGRFAVGMTNFTGSAGDGTGFGASPIGYIQVIRNQNPCAFLGRTVSTGNVVTLAYGSSNTNAGEVGSISVTASSTAYNTSSDYRLKENIQPMTGALTKVAALKPCTYKWKVDGSDGEGFIAHELAEVVPQAVNGEKDAVDADGNPVYQGIDTSFLVATLTAAIQEQQAMIQQLQAEVAALKGT